MLFAAMGDPAEVAAGKLTLGVIREELARIVRQRAADDPNLHYLDGLELYGEADAAGLPLPDQSHPDAATHADRRTVRRPGLRARRPVRLTAPQTTRRHRTRRVPDPVSGSCGSDGSDQGWPWYPCCCG